MLHRRKNDASVVVIVLKVALRERAAPTILARKPDRRAFGNQRPKRERLTGSPVRNAAFQQILPLLDEAFQLGVQHELIGECRDASDNILDLLLVHGRARTSKFHSVFFVNGDFLQFPFFTLFRGLFMGRVEGFLGLLADLLGPIA